MIAPHVVDDVSVGVAGQGGDGSLTLIELLARLLGRRGLHLYTARQVSSRIRGGHAAATLRASVTPHGCLEDRLDLLIAFDAEGVERLGSRLAPDGFVVFDESWGPAPVRALPPAARVVTVPFGRMTVRDLRQDLLKNTVALAVVARILGLGDDDLAAALTERFAHLPAGAVAANRAALRLGLEFADGVGLVAGSAPRPVAGGTAHGRLLMSGNDAVALGFLAAGGRFYCGYPITPASDILDRLESWLPRFGGVAVQVEDELAAVNMAAGAALAGARAMTASSGPGIALMQEGVSHLGAAEIPVVVVDCQRAGPSTGMPTRPEQSDLAMLAFGGNGDFPRLVLAPGDVADCFTLAAEATNLAQMLQGPVYLALDQALAQDLASVEPFNLDAVVVKPARRAAAGPAAAYRRYLLTADGISPWAAPGTPGAVALVTGNEHDEWGQVSIDPANRVRMIRKRAAKIDALRPELPAGRRHGDGAAPVGVLATGMATTVVRAAAASLAQRGVDVEVLQLRTLWPILDETLEFVTAKERVYVVEHNASGQLARILGTAGIPATRLRSVLKFDGAPFTPAGLGDEIAGREEAA